jgi:hypothetical protein
MKYFTIITLFIGITALISFINAHTLDQQDDDKHDKVRPKYINLQDFLKLIKSKPPHMFKLNSTGRYIFIIKCFIIFII